MVLTSGTEPGLTEGTDMGIDSLILWRNTLAEHRPDRVEDIAELDARIKVLRDQLPTTR